MQKVVNFTHFNPKKKNIYISGCKIVYIYIYIYINVHICIVIVTLQIIFYFFSLSFTSLSLFLSGASTLTSLFLSLVPHSQLTNLRSKLTITNRCRSKVTHRLPPKQAHLPINFRIFWLISGFWSFDLFNSLFDQWVMVG